MLEQGRDNITTLTYDYGQRHKRELIYASANVARFRLRHMLISLGTTLRDIGGSALTSSMDVPEGHYAEAAMKQTVVPGRNTIMLSVALSVAETLAREREEEVEVAYGAHAGDHYIYPDCRPEYIGAMQDVMQYATEGRVTLRAPFANMDKGDILIRALHSGVSLQEYANTWTCYKGEAEPCGKCGACVERAEAFAKAEVADPLLVAV